MANVIGGGTGRFLVDTEGDAVGVTGNALDVHLKTGTSTIDIGDVSLLLGGTAASVNNGAADATTLRVTIASDTTGVLSIDDNGSSITVDNGGTFAVQSTLQAGSAAIGKVGHDITGIQSDNNEGVDSTTAEALGGSQACKRVDMQADPANSGYIYVGGSDVSATKGIRLAAGEKYSVDIDNVADIFVLASVDEEDIHFNYFT